jgi:hypothetical protein
MPMLEVPGVFTMPFVPDGWTATANGDSFFELEPPDRSAAVHISIYRREPTALVPGQAQSYLDRFIYQSPTDGTPSVVVLPAEGQEQRVFATYRRRMEGGNLHDWFAGCILWPSAMLMCSCNAAPGNGALKQGETMIASIFQGTEES